jgi:hypothetical protein
MRLVFVGGRNWKTTATSTRVRQYFDNFQVGVGSVRTFWGQDTEGHHAIRHISFVVPKGQHLAQKGSSSVCIYLLENKNAR